MQPLSRRPAKERCGAAARCRSLSSTVTLLPCSALVSPREVTRKICSRARNSVKVSLQRNRDKLSRGEAEVDGGEQKTVVRLKLSPLWPHNQRCLRLVKDTRAARLHEGLSAEHNLHKLLPQWSRSYSSELRVRHRRRATKEELNHPGLNVKELPEKCAFFTVWPRSFIYCAPCPSTRRPLPHPL